jgi:putative transposase
MRRTYRYRLYPTRQQDAALHAQVDEACRLYNACLDERRSAWRMQRISLGYYEQANQLKAIRAAGDVGVANFSACQDVLRRVDKTFKAFFARVKRGDKAGYPRFKPRQRYDSLTYPSWGDGCRLTPAQRLYLQGVGALKVKWHRPFAGAVKTVSVKRETGAWYVCFSVECELEPLPPVDAVVGIDVGLTHFATLSDGTTVANPRHARQGQAKLRRAQRKVARCKRGSHGRKKAVQALQKANAHVRQQRGDFHHKTARALVQDYGLIAVEDLNTRGLAGGMLAKSVHDAGWGEFLDKLAYKAESAGRVLVRVNPAGTTQDCSACGVRVPKGLADRWHLCPACGLSLDRDHNAALGILHRALIQTPGWGVAAPTVGVAHAVAAEAACFS